MSSSPNAAVLGIDGRHEAEQLVLAEDRDGEHRPRRLDDARLMRRERLSLEADPGGDDHGQVRARPAGRADPGLLDRLAPLGVVQQQPAAAGPGRLHRRVEDGADERVQVMRRGERLAVALEGLLEPAPLGLELADPRRELARDLVDGCAELVELVAAGAAPGEHHRALGQVVQRPRHPVCCGKCEDADDQREQDQRHQDAQALRVDRVVQGGARVHRDERAAAGAAGDALAQRPHRHAADVASLAWPTPMPWAGPGPGPVDATDARYDDADALKRVGAARREAAEKRRARTDTPPRPGSRRTCKVDRAFEVRPGRHLPAVTLWSLSIATVMPSALSGSNALSRASSMSRPRAPPRACTSECAAMVAATVSACATWARYAWPPAVTAVTEAAVDVGDLVVLEQAQHEESGGHQRYERQPDQHDGKLVTKPHCGAPGKALPWACSILSGNYTLPPPDGGCPSAEFHRARGVPAAGLALSTRRARGPPGGCRPRSAGTRARARA